MRGNGEGRRRVGWNGGSRVGWSGVGRGRVGCDRMGRGRVGCDRMGRGGWGSGRGGVEVIRFFGKGGVEEGKVVGEFERGIAENGIGAIAV